MILLILFIFVCLWVILDIFIDVYNIVKPSKEQLELEKALSEKLSTEEGLTQIIHAIKLARKGQKTTIEIGGKKYMLGVQKNFENDLTSPKSSV